MVWRVESEIPSFWRKVLGRECGDGVSFKGLEDAQGKRLKTGVRSNVA